MLKASTAYICLAWNLMGVLDRIFSTGKFWILKGDFLQVNLHIEKGENHQHQRNCNWASELSLLQHKSSFPNREVWRYFPNRVPDYPVRQLLFSDETRAQTILSKFCQKVHSTWGKGLKPNPRTTLWRKRSHEDYIAVYSWTEIYHSHLLQAASHLCALSVSTKGSGHPLWPRLFPGAMEVRPSTGGLTVPAAEWNVSVNSFTAVSPTETVSALAHLQIVLTCFLKAMLSWHQL